jgi:hypothetical protein
MEAPMTVSAFIMLMTILSDTGTAGVAFIEIRKDIEARTAAGAKAPGPIAFRTLVRSQASP